MTNLIATQSETISQLQGDIEKINRRTKANERDTSILKSLLIRASRKPSTTEDIDRQIIHNDFKDTQADKEETVIVTSGNTGTDFSDIISYVSDKVVDVLMTYSIGYLEGFSHRPCVKLNTNNFL